MVVRHVANATPAVALFPNHDVSNVNVLVLLTSFLTECTEELLAIVKVSDGWVQQMSKRMNSCLPHTGPSGCRLCEQHPRAQSRAHARAHCRSFGGA